MSQEIQTICNGETAVIRLLVHLAATGNNSVDCRGSPRLTLYIKGRERVFYTWPPSVVSVLVSGLKSSCL